MTAERAVLVVRASTFIMLFDGVARSVKASATALSEASHAVRLWMARNSRRVLAKRKANSGREVCAARYGFGLHIWQPVTTPQPSEPHSFRTAP